MAEVNDYDPIGRFVEDYVVLGWEKDGRERTVGADMELIVPPIGRFFLNVVTKNHFLHEEVAETIEGIARPEKLLQPPVELEKKPPYVLNDRELSHEVLGRKFRGRVVEADLAETMWYEGPLSN